VFYIKSKISISIICIFVFLILFIKVNTIIESSNHIKKIDSIFIESKPNKTNYVGYIEIKSVGIKRGIVNGINDEILNSNDVGMIKNNNIILAGHSIINVFEKLHYVKVNDVINIYLYNKLNEYIVKKIFIVNKKDLSLLNNELVLITCMDNPDERLLIIAEKNI